MTQFMTPRPPGLYEAVPFETYIAWDAVNASSIKPGLRTWKYCKHLLDHPLPETDAKRFGRAVHSGVLEPDTFDRLYCLKPPGHHGSNIYKDAAAALMEAGYTLLSRNDYDRIRWIRDNAWAGGKVTEILQEMESAELSAIAFEPFHRTLIKCRYDCWLPAAFMIADLKTTRNAQEHAFNRQIEELGYHISAAFYGRVADLLGYRIDHHVLLACEVTPPHEVAARSIVPDAIEIGTDKVIELMTGFMECKQSDVWPSYSQGIEPAGLPGWAYYQHEEELE